MCSDIGGPSSGRHKEAPVRRLQEHRHERKARQQLRGRVPHGEAVHHQGGGGHAQPLVRPQESHRRRKVCRSHPAGWTQVVGLLKSNFNNLVLSSKPEFDH